MSVTLQERTGAYRQAARQVHAIETSDQPEADRVAAIKAVLAELAARPELFPPDAFPHAAASSDGLYRLAHSPDGRGGLYVSVAPTASPPNGVNHASELISETPVLRLHAYGHAAERPGFQPPLPALTLREAQNEAAAGRLAVIGLNYEWTGLAGPHVVVSNPDDAARYLAARGVGDRLPVLLIGPETVAGEVAATLYRAGHSVVFRLAA